MIVRNSLLLVIFSCCAIDSLLTMDKMEIKIQRKLFKIARNPLLVEYPNQTDQKAFLQYKKDQEIAFESGKFYTCEIIKHPTAIGYLYSKMSQVSDLRRILIESFSYIIFPDEKN